MGRVTVSGPLFDGTAEAVLAEGVREVREKLAAKGQSLARAAFAGMIRQPTGRFEGSVTQTDRSRTYVTASGHRAYSMPVVVPDSSTDIVVTTDLATYGPWLEGTGSRNDTTRFKGYHGFRMAGQELDGMSEGIADDTLRPYVARCD